MRIKRIKEWRGNPVRYVDAGWIKPKGKSLITFEVMRGGDQWRAEMWTVRGSSATGYGEICANPTDALDSAYEAMVDVLRSNEKKLCGDLAQLRETIIACGLFGRRA